MASYESIKYNVIADGVVTTDKLANTTVAGGDLNSTLNISSKTVTLPATSVTNGMLAGSIDVTSKLTGAIPVAKGGTGLTSVGSANQRIKVNSGANGLEFAAGGGAGNELFFSNQDGLGATASGNQVGNAMSFTPSVTGKAIFSGKFGFRHTGNNYSYFYPRNSSTQLFTYGEAPASSSTTHSQGAQWHVLYGNVSSGTTYNANLYMDSGGNVNAGGDSGDDLNLCINIIP